MRLKCCIAVIAAWQRRALVRGLPCMLTPPTSSSHCFVFTAILTNAKRYIELTEPTVSATVLEEYSGWRPYRNKMKVKIKKESSTLSKSLDMVSKSKRGSFALLSSRMPAAAAAPAIMPAAAATAAPRCSLLPPSSGLSEPFDELAESSPFEPLDPLACRDPGEPTLSIGWVTELSLTGCLVLRSTPEPGASGASGTAATRAVAMRVV